MAGYAARIGHMRNAENLKGRDRLEDLEVDGRKIFE
jgi:hypothetical protein